MGTVLTVATLARFRPMSQNKAALEVNQRNRQGSEDKIIIGCILFDQQTNTKGKREFDQFLARDCNLTPGRGNYFIICYKKFHHIGQAVKNVAPSALHFLCLPNVGKDITNECIVLAKNGTKVTGELAHKIYEKHHPEAVVKVQGRKGSWKMDGIKTGSMSALLITIKGKKKEATLSCGKDTGKGKTEVVFVIDGKQILNPTPKQVGRLLMKL